MSDETIDLSKPRYPQDTFSGRLRHFIEITNPLNLFAGAREISEAKTSLEHYKSGLKKDSAENLWKAKLLVDSSVHPDTGEVIFFPFRMSAYVPTNLVVTAGLLLPNPTTAGIVFWQWANQSVNVAINWANANKSTPMSPQETGIAYGTAVAASVGVALGLTSGVKKLNLSPHKAYLMGRCIPFAAVASASSLNVFLMRRKEITQGIKVMDKDGNDVGVSKEAGLKAVSQVAASRVITAFPALVLPPILMAKLEKTTLLKNNPRLAMPFNLALISFSLVTALPAAIALFPQIGKLHPKDEAFKDKYGNQLSEVYYNKGL
ncbi:Sideroflexin FSF1 [Entomophthora muscae]|uniref:Sideroflexin FSF1 n=2 Tax=Entomophthora muscae TaxID=34485 RepID=A0ACC2TZF5_9FUNG|nr:Sideroflexin FSF1 [Entomophthora muscae]